MNCDLCKKTFLITGTTKTLDGGTICKQCYDLVSEELKKGIFSTKEAIKCKELIKQQHEELMTALLRIRKAFLNEGITAKKTSKKLITKEEEVSVLVFMKTRECLTRDEHLKLVTLLSSDIKKYFGIVSCDDLVMNINDNSLQNLTNNKYFLFKN